MHIDTSGRAGGADQVHDAADPLCLPHPRVAGDTGLWVWRVVCLVLQLLTASRSNTMEAAQSFEKTFGEFFLNVKVKCRRMALNYSHNPQSVLQSSGPEQFAKWTQREKSLQSVLASTQLAVHAALCDSIDTVGRAPFGFGVSEERILCLQKTTMQRLIALVNAVNIYLQARHVGIFFIIALTAAQDVEQAKVRPSTLLLKRVAQYVTKIFSVCWLALCAVHCSPTCARCLASLTSPSVSALAPRHRLDARMSPFRLTFLQHGLEEVVVPELLEFAASRDKIRQLALKLKGRQPVMLLYPLLLLAQTRSC